MTKENLIKLHKHLKFLSEGKFSEADFSKEYSKESYMNVGKLSTDRKNLIISDAKKNLAELERKHEFLKEEVKEEPQIETKSKGKK